MRIITFIFTSFATLFLLWILGWLWFATSIAIAEPVEAKMKTDAIIVVTGGNGRVNAGLDLLDDGQAPKLFISGVHKAAKKSDIYKSWKRPTSKRKSNKPCCVYLGYEALDTNQNAIEVSDWVKKNRIETIRLVTSTYHMPRTMHLVKRKLPDTTVKAYPVFTDDFEPWKGRFWSLSFSEYNKFLFSYIAPSSITPLVSESNGE